MAIAAPPSTNGQAPSVSQSDPIEPIRPDRFETIEFPARDGFMLNFKRLPPRVGWRTGSRCCWSPGRAPAPNLFNPPTDNLLKLLTKQRF